MSMSHSVAGYIGGRSTSKRKRAASKENGKKGGRPRGSMGLSAFCIGGPIDGIKALELRRQGKTLRAIADELAPGVDPKTVSRAIKRAEALEVKA